MSFLAGAEAGAAELELVFSQLHGTGAGAEFFLPKDLEGAHDRNLTSSETLLMTPCRQKKRLLRRWRRNQITDHD